jgi:hypothetical protein
MVTFGIKEDPPLVALQGGYSTPSHTSGHSEQGGIYKRVLENTFRGRDMGRRDYDEGYEDTRRDMMDCETGPQRGSDGTFIKYAAIVIVVLAIAYVVRRIVGAIQGAF